MANNNDLPESRAMTSGRLSASTSVKNHSVLNPDAPTFYPKLSSRPTICISQLNVQSILNKFSDIEQSIKHDWNSDIYCFSETWLKPTSTTNSFLEIEDYSYFRRDRLEKAGGGLLVYFADRLRVKRRPDLETKEIECITFELSDATQTHILFFVYRPPDLPSHHFVHQLSSLLSTAESEFAVISVLGDMNAKHPTWNSGPCNSAGNGVFEVMTDFTLSQCITEPTRFSADGNSASTIDLYVTNRPDLVQSCKISDPMSDHCLVSITISSASTTTDCQHSRDVKYLPDFDRADWSGLRQELALSPLLSAIQGTQDINIAVTVWERVFRDILHKWIPFRVLKSQRNRKDKKWITADLRRLARHKQRLFRAARSSRSSSDWSEYCRARNHCTAKFRRAKAAYLTRQHQLLSNAPDGSRRWWELAKSMAKIRSPFKSIPTLKAGGSYATTDSEKASVLATFFAKQCSDNNPLIDQPGAPYPSPENHPHFDFPPIAEPAVVRTLQNLPANKSTADQLVTNRVLRECSSVIAPSVAYLFNLSVSTGVFPSQWKNATVIPVYKHRGEAQDPSNYRPISLLPALGKALDSIQCSRLLSYFLKQNLLSTHQFGFLPRRSTTTQLIYLCDRWLNALDKGDAITAVFLDFHKAFDRVWHKGLLYKLALFGVSSFSLAWLTSYLSDRKIAVRVGSSVSASTRTTCGVPQGSHLGPLLFLAFINDLPATSRIPCNIFADDTLLHQLHPKLSPRPSYIELQAAIDRTEDWAVSWNGQFGHAKTKIMSTNSEKLLQAITPTINGIPIEIVSEHRHLGVYLTENFSWVRHIQHLLTVSSQRAGLLRLMCHHFPPQATARLYVFYVRPTLEYGSPVWNGFVREEDAIALERLQASVARSILKADWRTPKSDLLRELDLPSLRWRREIASLVLLHKLLQSRQQPLAECLFPFASSVTDRSRRKPKQLILPKAHSTRVLKSFFYRTALAWNTLPAHTQALQTPSQFRSALETHFNKFKYLTDNSLSHTFLPT